MDVIDERNRKQKMAKSVIKRRNVIYTYRPLVKEAEEALQAQEEAKESLNGQNAQVPLTEEEQAKEVLKRVTEARPSGRKVQQEVENLLAQQEEKNMEIERILSEKEKQVEQVKHTARQQGEA